MLSIFTLVFFGLFLGVHGQYILSFNEGGISKTLFLNFQTCEPPETDFNVFVNNINTSNAYWGYFKKPSDGCFVNDFIGFSFLAIGNDPILNCDTGKISLKLFDANVCNDSTKSIDYITNCEKKKDGVFLFGVCDTKPIDELLITNQIITVGVSTVNSVSRQFVFSETLISSYIDSFFQPISMLSYIFKLEAKNGSTCYLLPWSSTSFLSPTALSCNQVQPLRYYDSSSNCTGPNVEIDTNVGPTGTNLWEDISAITINCPVSSSSSSDQPLIIGLAVGGGVLVMVGIFYWRKRMLGRG